MKSGLHLLLTPTATYRTKTKPNTPNTVIAASPFTRLRSQVYSQRETHRPVSSNGQHIHDSVQNCIKLIQWSIKKMKWWMEKKRACVGVKKKKRGDDFRSQLWAYVTVIGDHSAESFSRYCPRDQDSRCLLRRSVNCCAPRAIGQTLRSFSTVSKPIFQVNAVRKLLTRPTRFTY